MRSPLSAFPRAGAPAVFCLLVLAPAARADDWPAYQHDAGHTGRSTASFDPGTLTHAWTAPARYATPLVVGDTVYGSRTVPGSGGRTEYASFNLADGRVNWTVGGNFAARSQAAVGGGLLVYAAQETDNGPARLYVHDAATGAPKYTVPLPSAHTVSTPTVHQDPATGSVSAYYTSWDSLNGILTAMSLGETSGSVRWSGTGMFDQWAIPTVAGESIVVAADGQFYAFRAADGARNNFATGAYNGLRGLTAVYDDARDRIYVLGNRGAPGGTVTSNVLSAFDYADNATITELWTTTGPGINGGGSVAVGADGKLYAAGQGFLVEIDPDTGRTLRSAGPQPLAVTLTPALQDGYVWVYDESQTHAFDLDTLALAHSVPGSRGSSNSPFAGPGAIAGNYFIIDRGVFGDVGGFLVYRAVPEPGAALLGAAAAAPLLLRRRR